MVEIHDRHGIALLSGEFRSRVDALGNTEKDAPLTDRRGRIVIGEVELEVDVLGLPPRQCGRELQEGEMPPSILDISRGS